MRFCFFSSRRRHTRCALVTGVQTCALPICDARVKAAKEALKDQLKEAGWNAKDIAAHLRRGYPSYWSGVDTDSHLRHARLVREAEASGAPLTIDTRVDRYRQATEVTVYTPDHPGQIGRAHV